MAGLLGIRLVIRAERPKGLQWSAFSEEPAGALAFDGWITRHSPRDPDRETTPAGLLASLVIRAERPKGLRWSTFSEEPAGALALDGWITRHSPRDPVWETTPAGLLASLVIRAVPTPANRKPQSAFADSGIFFLTFLQKQAFEESSKKYPATCVAGFSA